LSTQKLRQNFFPSEHPAQPSADFAMKVHRKYPWKQKSVLCIILTRNEKFFLTMTPRKLKEGTHTQVPMQGRLSRLDSFQKERKDFLVRKEQQLEIKRQELELQKASHMTQGDLVAARGVEFEISDTVLSGDEGHDYAHLMQFDSLGYMLPEAAASEVLKRNSGIFLQAQKLHYIGYGFTKNYHKGDEFGKILHVVGGMFGDPRPLPANDYASSFDWVPVSDLPTYAEQMMSTRKSWMLQNAILHAPPREKYFKARQLQEVFF